MVSSGPSARGQCTSTPTSRSAPTSVSRVEISSPSRVSWSGTDRPRKRSRTGHTSAAARRAMLAWIRARGPNPCSSSEPVHSTAASQTCSGSRSSWTWRTTRTEPATSSSSSASTRSETRTSSGRSAIHLRAPSASASRAVRSARRRRTRSAKSSGRRSGPAGPAGSRRDGAGRVRTAGAARGIASATASRTRRTSPAASSAVRSSCARASARRRTASWSRASRPSTRHPGCWSSRVGATFPAATSRRPRRAAPLSSATLGCASSVVCARLSTGSAARTGSATVRRGGTASVNSMSDSPSSPDRKVAGPVTGTKLTRGR